MNTLRKTIQKLGRDERGGAIVFLATCILILIIAVGVAVDLGRAHLVRSKLQTAVDAATLSAGAVASSQNITSVVNNYFRGNFPLNYMASNIDPLVITVYNPGGAVVDPDAPGFDGNVGRLNVKAFGRVDTVIMKIVGKRDVEISAEAEVRRVVNANKLEVALVVDNSCSMKQPLNIYTCPATPSPGTPKINMLKSAVNNFLDAIYKGQASDPNVKVAIIPYDRHVNPPVGALPPDIPTPDGGLPGPCNGFPQPAPYYGCFPYQSRTGLERVTSFTTSRTTLQSKVNALNGVGLTSIPNGIQWGLDALDPSKSGLFNHSANPVPFGTTDTNKVLIILTDGHNDACARYPAFIPPMAYPAACTNQVAAWDAQIEPLCNAAKAQGITVYTMTFNAPSGAMLNIFRNCASSPAFYFDAPAQSQLDSAFLTIADSLYELRLIR